LMEINLRRSEMPFRVTDVALLQLGQGCQSRGVMIGDNVIQFTATITNSTSTLW